VSSVLHQILDRGGFSPTTRASYNQIIDRWIAFAGADPAGWTRIRAQEFYDGLLASGTVSVASANIYIASLRYVSRWYATRASDPQLDFAVVQTRGDEAVEKTRRALTGDEALQLLDVCRGPSLIDHRDRVLILLGLETGMRRMSLAGITFENIIKRQGSYSVVAVPIKGLGGAMRYDVPLSDLALGVLEGWREKLKRKSGPAFPRFRHTAGKLTPAIGADSGISLQMINKVLATRAKEAGVRDVHPHILRHTFITWRLEAGYSFMQIASITGHKTFTDHTGGGARAMAPYVDMTMLAEQIRNATPPWLALYIAGLT
jgi:integrase